MVIFIIICLTLMFTAPSSSPSTFTNIIHPKHQTLDTILHNLEYNASTLNLAGISQLMKHRNELQSELNSIDSLITENAAHISNLLSIKSKNSSSIPISSKEEQIETIDEFTADLILPSIKDIQSSIVKEFQYAWLSYKECAFGFDILHPLSCKGTNNGFNLGLTIIDSLDTMIIMSNNGYSSLFITELHDMKEWITNDMTFDTNTGVSFFETTIRILGGLLSAYSLTNDTVYKMRAQALGDKLLNAFNTKSGLPFSTINLQNGKAFNPSWSRASTSTSEIATVQLEFNYLSYITNNGIYAQKARNAQQIVIDIQRNSNPALLRKWISINNKHPHFTDRKISIGSRIDSSYEYYFKIPLQLSFHSMTNSVLQAYYDSMSVIKEKLFRYSFLGNLYVCEMDINGGTSDQFDHLACFIGGTYALSSASLMNANGNAFHSKELSMEHLKYSRELVKTCTSVYMNTNTGLAPEIVYFRGDDGGHGKDFDIHDRDKHNILRPETIESIFYLYRVTHDVKYRKWAYKIFLAFKKYSRVEVNGRGGYASIQDVTVSNKMEIKYRGDVMESFFMAETLKYLFLIFSDDSVMNISEYVFNTEAHPFPILTQEQASVLF